MCGVYVVRVGVCVCGACGCVVRVWCVCVVRVCGACACECVCVRGAWVCVWGYLSISITDKYHLVQQFSIRGSFWPYFPEYEQELLDLVIAARQHEAYDGHQQSGKTLSIEHELNELLESIRLHTSISMFCVCVCVCVSV